MNGVTKEGDANEVLGIQEVNNPIKPRASIFVPIEREITLDFSGNSDSNESRTSTFDLKRQISNHMKRVCDSLFKCVSQEHFLELSQLFAYIKISYDDYKIKLNDMLDSEGISNFTDSTSDQFKECFNS